MSDPDHTDRTGPDTPAADLSDEERRRRRAAVFGDVLPETTGDERDAAPERGGPADDRGDEWLRRQVPPHHGG